MKGKKWENFLPWDQVPELCSWRWPLLVKWHQYLPAVPLAVPEQWDMPLLEFMCLKKYWVPAVDAGCRMPPCAAFFFFFFGNKPADPLGESWRNTWKLDKCHRHCDPQPGCLCPSPICALLALSFPEGGMIRPRTPLAPVGSDHSHCPGTGLSPKAIFNMSIDRIPTSIKRQGDIPASFLKKFYSPTASHQWQYCVILNK